MGRQDIATTHCIHILWKILHTDIPQSDLVQWQIHSQVLARALHFHRYK